MVFKKFTLTNGAVVYLRQGITMCDVVTSGHEGLEFNQFNMSSPEMRTLLDNIQRDTVVTSHQEEWEQVYELFVKLNT